MMSELERTASIENLVDRKIYFMSILTREAEKKNVQPVVVGGSAVEFYTEGIYPSYDIDLVGNRRIIGGILEKTFGFKPSGRHWINEEIGLYIEIPSSYLMGDKNKITIIRVENLPVYVLGLEDLIIDRINACVYWKSHTDCEQAQFLLRQYQNRLDFKYLEKKARDEGQLRALKRLVAGKPVWKMTAKGQKLWYKK
ncbi:MAG: hypothetical protein QMD78_05550 [Methanocellales archaeon]|nr:hypothetical protein [Methanocellales archaeon]